MCVCVWWVSTAQHLCLWRSRYTPGRAGGAEHPVYGHINYRFSDVYNEWMLLVFIGAFGSSRLCVMFYDKHILYQKGRVKVLAAWTSIYASKPASVHVLIYSDVTYIRNKTPVHREQENVANERGRDGTIARQPARGRCGEAMTRAPHSQRLNFISGTWRSGAWLKFV